MDTSVALRIASQHKDKLMDFLETSDSKEFVTVEGTTVWRSDPAYLDILVALTSTGSLAILARLIHAWISRKNGYIEVINTRTGIKATFKGPLPEAPMKEIEDLLASNKPTSTLSGRERTDIQNRSDISAPTFIRPSKRR